MPDYLEELLDNAQALLEQVRRLERSGSGPALETEGAGLPSASRPDQAEGERTEEGPSPIPRGEARRRAPEAASRAKEAENIPAEGGPAEDAALEPPQRVLTPLEEEERNRESSPLLEQLERLERAAGSGIGDSAASRSVAWGAADSGRRTALPSGLAGGWREGAYPDASGAAGEDWSPGSPIARPGSGAEELQWAEQADRAFRRDSRRYDGGFYLY